MDIENNPLYVLAQVAYREGVPEQEVIARPESQELIKRIDKKKHYRQANALVGRSLFETIPDSEIAPHLALISYHCAVRKAQQIRKTDFGALCLLAGVHLLNRFEPEQGLKVLRMSQRAFLRVGRNSYLAHVDAAIAHAYFLMGKAVAARERFDKWLDLYWSKKRMRREPHFSLQVANILGLLGEYDQAIRCLDLDHQNEDGSDAVHVKISGSLLAAKWYRNMGKYNLALETIEALNELPGYDEISPHRIEVTWALGNLCSSVGDNSGAIAKFREVLELSDREGKESLCIRARLMLALAYHRDGRSDEAVVTLQDCTEYCERTGDKLTVAECLVYQAGLYAETERYDEALEILRTAREVFVEHKRHAYVAMCDRGLAWIYAENGDLDRAVPVLEAQDSLYWHGTSLMGCYGSEHGLGVAYQKAGHLDKARKHFEAAIASLESVRAGLEQADYRSSFLESKHSIYVRMIDCLLAQGEFATALEYVERLKSRNLADLLLDRNYLPQDVTEEDEADYNSLRAAIGELSQSLKEERDPKRKAAIRRELLSYKKEFDDLINDLSEDYPGFDPYQTATISYQEIKDLVPDDGTALVEIFPMKDKTVAFVVLRRQEEKPVTIIIDDYTHADLEQDLVAVRDPNRLDAILESLYSRIFAPLEPYLGDIKRLILIPYGGLHLIPLQAMFTIRDDSREYLLDRYLVTYAPSAKVLKACGGRKRPEKPDAFVAFADTRNDLRYAGYESSALGRYFGTAVNHKVTRQRIVEQCERSNIFHFAGHADGKALILHAHDDDTREDRFDAGDIVVNITLPDGWLATLSACDTGQVKVGKADEYIGLPSAFLHAGAATVICSLWSVSDLFTTLLMSKMYELIAEGRGKAESLHEAQRWLKDPRKRAEHLAKLDEFSSLRERSPEPGLPDSRRFTPISATDITRLEDLEKPYHWAGFICTGAP